MPYQNDVRMRFHGLLLFTEQAFNVVLKLLQVIVTFLLSTS